MRIHDGKYMDKTNFASDEYIKINSSGIQNISTTCTVIRENGRKDYHLLLVDKGECQVSKDGKSYTLKEGNFVIYAPGEMQKYVLEEGSSSLWCHFTGSIVPELLASCSLESGVYFVPPQKAAFNSFAELIQRSHSPHGKKLANASFLELIYNLESAINAPFINEKQNAIIPVLTYINFNYQKELSLSHLANMAGYSMSRFSHLFSEVTGCTPIKYQNEIRLKTASEMLVSTDSSITEIALSVGFSDSLYFSRLFKKNYGVPPTEYRKKR